ncbi:MAG: LysE family translocator [Hydrococcus sp. Prado102]|jgi:threonine/homoserine/homoserine lactone efflux protein|nr:LysE family translocator [Hydrococcus sp. Prado102]
MFDLSNLTLFLVAAIVLVITPGPDTLYVIARSIGQGRKAGIISALGICVGLVVHISAAAIGLSALLMTSAIAYSIVKYVGAAYLIYLGIRTIFDRDAHNPANTL